MPDLMLTRLAGDADADHLLVLGPSLGTSVSALWAQCAALLDDRFEVVGWDLPGHGRSPAASGPFSVADLADSVRLRATELAAGRRAAYAGVSLGGAVAYQLAIEPGPFGAVAAIASAPRLGEPAAWHERAELVRRAGTAVMVAPSSTRWFAPGFVERQPDTAGALLTSLSEADSGSYAWACEALAELDLRDALTQTAVPVLAVAGEHDQVVPPAVVEETARACPGAAFGVLTGCGHLPPAEDPAAMASTLSDFLVGLTVGRPTIGPTIGRV